jgi:hypothetical protein
MTFQADLLSFFGQELIAHGATLFAIVTAAFTFMASMRPKEQDQDLLRASIYLVISGFLIGAGLYTLFRMLWYGALVSGVMRTPVDAGQDLWSYSQSVVAVTKSALNAHGFPYGYSFVALFSGSLNGWPTLAVCLCAGLSIALLIFLIEPVGGKTGPTYNGVILLLCIDATAIAVMVAGFAVASWI